MLTFFRRRCFDLHQAVKIGLIGQGCLPWLIFLVMMMPAKQVGTLCRATLPAHCCRSRPPQDAAMRPIIADIRASCSIVSAGSFVCRPFAAARNITSPPPSSVISQQGQKTSSPTGSTRLASVTPKSGRSLTRSGCLRTWCYEWGA